MLFVLILATVFSVAFADWLCPPDKNAAKSDVDIVEIKPMLLFDDNKLEFALLDGDGYQAYLWIRFHPQSKYNVICFNAGIDLFNPPRGYPRYPLKAGTTWAALRDQERSTSEAMTSAMDKSELEKKRHELDEWLLDQLAFKVDGDDCLASQTIITKVERYHQDHVTLLVFKCEADEVYSVLAFVESSKTWISNRVVPDTVPGNFRSLSSSIPSGEYQFTEAYDISRADLTCGLLGEWIDNKHEEISVEDLLENNLHYKLYQNPASIIDTEKLEEDVASLFAL